jgi:hypothetical protein
LAAPERLSKSSNVLVLLKMQDSNEKELDITNIMVRNHRPLQIPCILKAPLLHFRFPRIAAGFHGRFAFEIA